MFDDISNWRFTDYFEGVPLSEMPRLSSRARSLFIRSRDNPNLKSGFINVLGAIDMMAGLDYHAENYSRWSDAIGKGVLSNDENVLHEAVAYINRAGQFFAFAKSDFTARLIDKPLEIIPSISRIMIFRNKHTAHRSIDAPRDEDIGEHWRHAQSLGSLAMRIFSPRPGKQYTPDMKGFDPALHYQKLWETHFLTFNTVDRETGSQVNFSLEEEHPAIISEAYSLIERLLAA